MHTDTRNKICVKEGKRETEREGKRERVCVCERERDVWERG